MEYYVKEIPINAPVVVYNGSGVYDFEKEEFVFTRFMNDKCISFVDDLCGKFPFLCAEVYLEDSEYVVQANEITKRHFEFIRLEMIEKKSNEIPLPWVKVNFVAPEELVLEVEEYAKNYHGEDWFFQRSGNNFFEAMSKGVDKGTGASAVCETMGISPEKLYTIGDHLNDIELIEAAGISFCPENAVPYIKEISKVMVADNNNHAVAKAIEYLDKMYGN